MERLISALNVKSTHLLGDRDITLANWLLDTAENLGIAEGRHIRFSRAISQREVAEALGVARETISLRLNEWERAGLINTGGQSQRFEILDYPRVALRAAIRKQDAPAAITAALEEIDADLDRGELVRARNVALDMMVFFPSSPDLRHRVALANIRAGSVRESVDVLATGGYATGGDIHLLRDRIRIGLRNPGVTPARLFFGQSESFDADDGEDVGARVPRLTEDMAAIEARARKELAFAARDEGGRQRYATVSAGFYETIFDETGGYYAGINAAMMARIADETQKSAAIAGRVVARLNGSPKGYWANATLGEANLLLGDKAAAAAAFDAACRQDDVSDGKVSSTRLQVRRLAGHAAMDAEAILAKLPIGRTAVYSGRIFRGSELDAATQQRLEDSARPRIAAALEAERIRYLFGGLACGGDIVVAEAALDAGAELHVVLPFPVESFIEISVAVGNPPGGADRWVDRFWSCLNRSTSLSTVVEAAPTKYARDAHVYHGFRLAAGLALLRADILTSTCAMLAVSDGRTASNLAGTPRAMREWTAAGRALIDVSIDPEAPGDGDDDEATDVFAPVVFLWPLDGAVDLAEICRVAAAETGQRLDFATRTSRDRRTGAAIQLPDMKAALDVLESLGRHCRATQAPVRIVADFGPVFDARGNVSDALISRLSGASDLMGFPATAPVATMPFAAQARLAASQRVALVPIGRTASGPAADSRPLAAREVYALFFASDPDGRHSLASVSLTHG